MYKLNKWVPYVGARVLVALPCLMVAQVASAQEDVAYDEEMITIGTRSSAGRTAMDSPVPVDLINADDMAATGATEVGRMLQSLAPSFNFSSSSISDGTDALRPATLRGLGPDQTLVLVNGQRRHNSALIHVNTSVGRGTAGTDMNAIPVSAIKRIEILRDGAAAQYGSDAIAGVINIVLKDDPAAGSAHASYGEYSEGDGETTVLSTNKGFAVGSDGYVNLSLEFRDRGNTNRAGLTGVCQYKDTCVELSDGSYQTSDEREINFDRKNFRIGDADSEQTSAVLTFGKPLADALTLDGSVTYSTRDNTSAGFYRRANQSANNPSEMYDGTPVNGGEAFYPDGFLPLINTTIDDYSAAAGLSGDIGSAWQWHSAVGFGQNDFAYNISNSVNASLVSLTGDSPTSAFAGELSLSLFTFDNDFVNDTDWGLLALGAGYRQDTYQIKQGDEVSYRDYDTTDGVSLGENDAAGGIQVFPGFQPENAVDESRDAFYAYVDTEFDITESFMVSAAARFENFSDFGDTINFKTSFSYDAATFLTFRGAVSTGFRAPSMHQLYTSNVSTQFNSQGVAEQVGTFRNDSAIGRELGLPELKEETSLNSSVGFILHPAEGWSLTTDFYRIEIEDRIVISGRISETDGAVPSVDQAFADAGVGTAQFFLNAADTTTQGVDIVLTYDHDFSNGGMLGVSLAGNYTETEVDSVRSPDSLSDVPGIQDLIFTEQDRSILEEWQPEDRVNLSFNYRLGPFASNLAFNRYGSYTVLDGDSQTFSAKTLVDLKLSYDFMDNLTFALGGNNIFDVTPDENHVGQSRAGRIVDASGNVVVDTEGVFFYSRRSAPFGFNGAFFYTNLTYHF
ncbi:TonB-dependent receptor plug domain-containing protein [Teredinibacter turnerae]|uniref:TonB-dependent receptor plug domain-containing protein n=1 Tax=Teredinibacter turnerae TaxID=2426 RepID=UPI0005F890F6|nr:TonB-dependent receptor [Teredinibacter turnerae]